MVSYHTNVLLPFMSFYTKPKKITALDAKFEAQKIAFAPITFQAARCLLKFNILSEIDKAKDSGVTVVVLAQKLKLSEYAVGVLLDMGLSMGLVWQQDDKFILDKVGHFLLNDDMSQVNLNFSHDLCYQGLFELENSLLEGKPKGLEVFGDWETIYPALSQLPDDAKASWFEFDHYYSDHAFPALLPIVFEHKPRTLVDVGGNTGKWAIACTEYDPKVEVTIMDFPGQLKVAHKNALDKGLEKRIKGYPTDLLDESKAFVAGADIYWMSQFLDCFAKKEILSILKRAAAVMGPNSQLFIVETFWDRQPFEAAAYCVNATSLYFTAMANGNSRMYHSKDMLSLISAAGMYVDEDIDNLGLGHTLLKCKLK